MRGSCIGPEDAASVLDGLPLEVLQRLQGHEQEVAAPARGVEHAHPAQALQEGLEDRRWVLRVAGRAGDPLARQEELRDARLHLGVLGAQRSDHDGLHELPDLLAGRVVGAELSTTIGVEPALEEGPEDRGLDLRPVEATDLEEGADLGLGEREDVGRVEQPAVEPGDLFGPEHPAAVGHPREELAESVSEQMGTATGLLGHSGEDAPGQHPSVLGEQAEQDAVEEVGDGLRVVAAAAEG
jgi:hypothetical protein